MTMNNTSPILDSQQQERFNIASPGLAEEMLSMFAQELIEMRTAINQSFENKNFAELGDLLHKLIGGCSYCGLPRLKIAATSLEKARKQQELDIQLLQHVNQEIAAVLSALQEKGIISS